MGVERARIAERRAEGAGGPQSRFKPLDSRYFRTASGPSRSSNLAGGGALVRATMLLAASDSEEPSLSVFSEGP